MTGRPVEETSTRMEFRPSRCTEALIRVRERGVALANGKQLRRTARVIDRKRVSKLLDHGLSGRAIVRELGAPPTSVRRVIKALRQSHRKRGRRRSLRPPQRIAPPALTPRELPAIGETPGGVSSWPVWTPSAWPSPHQGGLWAPWGTSSEARPQQL